MTRPVSLPVGLEPWSEALQVLTPGVLSGLLPMIHGIDALITRRDAGSGPHGSLDGYDGLTNRGLPERIVTSEWLIADELPMEFLRRATHGELLYLAPAHDRPLPRGRVVAVVDNGPYQLGAPRLVQLAALIVLHRRAAERGAELELGLLGDDPDRWHRGDFASLFDAWRAGRCDLQPGGEVLTERLAGLPAGAEVWTLTGAELVVQPGTSSRVVRISEATWGADGSKALHVELDGDLIELAVPSAEVAVRALRGSSFRRESAQVSLGPDNSLLRFPTFGSAAPQLLMRGNGDAEIFTVPVSPVKATSSGRLRRHVFPGGVIAAAYLGRRLAALTVEDGRLHVRVAGKPLGLLDQLAVATDDVGLSRDEIQRMASSLLAPMYYAAGSILCELDGIWWRIGIDEQYEYPAIAVAPGPQLDNPRTARRTRGGVWVDGHTLPNSTAVTRVVLGHEGWSAVSEDGVAWRLYHAEKTAPAVVIGDAAEVLALVVEEGEPKLITLSAGGLVVRVVSGHGMRTLTRWSGTAGRPTIHPRLPLIAVQRAAGLVEIGNLVSGEVVHVVRSNA